jgi:hypothetical protein
MTRYNLLTTNILFVFSILFNFIHAQTYYKFGFENNQEIEVKKESRVLLYPWAGGINSVFFSQIDLNLDGVSDFIAFEKHGDKILPFINIGTNTQPHFVYAPEYKYRFPKLHDWVILKDFNNDGKQDIFTYNDLGGIRVFENISNQELAFKLVADPIKSNQYGHNVNIFTSPDDYLGIADINGDGKLDILNFFVFGKYVHLHKNISGNHDFFNYTLADTCWGKFAEAADNNTITLFSDCKRKSTKETNPKHVGSSIYIFDFNDDGLQDIVIGDVDFPELILLINGGTKEEALMVSQTSDFPNAQNPVHLYSMPAVSTMDFWSTTKPDLFVSPSDPSLTKSEDLNSVWHYHFDTELNDYVLKTKSFLQEDMIDVGSGAVPVLYDWRGTGVLDLFIANYGSFDSAKLELGGLKSHYSSSITYYKNAGTSNNPKFEWVTSDFGDLKKYGFVALHPTFADLNGDGKIDLLCGNRDSTLIFFENTAPAGELPQFKMPVTKYQNINIGMPFSAPQLFDIDRDGTLDLIIGNRRGTLTYYKNEGTNQNPNFQRITSNFGNVDVRDINFHFFGHSTPCFFRHNDETLLLCGSLQGELYLFSNIDNNLAGDFTLLEKIAETVQNKTYKINEGTRVAAAIADITDDNKPDLFIGNWAGGVSFFKGSEPHINKISEKELNDILVYPNPTMGELRITNYELRITGVEIYDVFGRRQKAESRMQNAEEEEFLTINISNLATGFYFVKITTEFGVVTKKVVKL